MKDNKIKAGSIVMDLGSGQGITSVFLAKEYGFKVYATDLWSDAEENRKFFAEMGLTEDQIIPVKADATDLKYEKEFFDAVVSTDSYNYFGRDEKYLDERLLPFVKKGGYIYIVVPGMKKDCHNNIPKELLLSWTPEQLDYIHDIEYWKNNIPVIVKDRELLASIYARADLFLFPSLYDASSIVQIESASQKTPGVFLKGSATSATVTDNVNGFISENTIGAYSDKIIEVMNDDKLLNKVKENAFIDLYVTWDKKVDEVYRIYLKKIKENKHKIL